MGKTYEYTGTNSSAIITVKTADKIENAHARAVKLSGAGAKLPAAGEEPVGIILLSQSETIEKDSDVDIQVKDIGFWRAGEAVTVGEALAVDADGRCRKATTGQYVYARALNEATAADDLILVQIINAGYLK